MSTRRKTTRKAAPKKSTTKSKVAQETPEATTLEVTPMFEVVAKKTVTDGNGNFYTNQITSSVDDAEKIDELQELLNGKIDEAIEAYSGFEAADEEEAEEEYEDEPEEDEEEDEEYDEDGDEEEADEDEEDEEDEDEDELTEDDIMKMKKSELVELIDEEELDIDIKGMKIKDIREAVIDEMFVEDEDEEYDEEFDEDED